MGASSVTGKGLGDSNKFTSNELSILANGPQIIFTGFVSVEPMSSPPSSSNEVIFPYSLPGGADSYVVMLTSINGAAPYISHRDEDSYNNFTGFTVISDDECDVMYLVAKVGQKPNL